VRFDDTQDARGKLFNAGKRSLELVEPMVRTLALKLDASSETIRYEAAEKEIRISDRRLIAFAKADGAGVGAGGLRTDMKETTRIEAGDGATARAGSMDVEHRNADGYAGNLRVGNELWPFVAFDEKYICRGSTHVETDDTREARDSRGLRGPNYAACRTGENGPDGLLCGGARR
jgi:hypothetical protein